MSVDTSKLFRKAKRSQLHLKLLLGGPSGCITGDTVISLNRAKRSYRQSIKKLYECTHKVTPGRKRNKLIKTYVRSYSESLNDIVLNEVKGVVYSGKKQVYKLVLENGLTLKATSCHKIMTNKGFKGLKNIKKNDCIMCDHTQPIKKGNLSKLSGKSYDLKRRVKFHKYARKVDSKRDGKYKEVEMHRLIYEANLNNLNLDKFLYILNNNEEKSKKLKLVNPKIYAIHHIDFNHQNNNINNLQKLTHEKHLNLHSKFQSKTNKSTHYFSRVLEVSKLGVEDTYDIQCKAPNHNFVANNIVIHNSGKTYSSLLLAKGFQGSLDKTVVIDTEDSADVYDRLGGYSVVDFKPPFDPRRLVKLIDICIENKFEFIIIDSLTKFWDGEGGALDLHQKFGGRFQDWAKVTPIWDGLLQKIVHCDAHAIACTRKKQDYAMEQDGKSKAKVQKMGLKNIVRDGAEYEFTTALDIDINHNVMVNKDRTGIFEPICPVMLTDAHGKMLKEWCNGN